MTAQEAEHIVMQMTKPFFAFAQKRCANTQDAEDLAQDALIKLYRALLLRNDIAEPEKFAWTIAHNTLANYYRSRSRVGASVPIYGLASTLSTNENITLAIETAETANRLHREIAYLSKTRRQIVIMYYFENKRQQDIAAALGLPLGTVKWYLSEAKTDLQKGMETMRKSSELKFNPITLEAISTNGSMGTMGNNATMLRSALAQNILYLAYQKPMTINDIADALGTSPVFVESDVAFLEQNRFLLKQGKGYLTNILIDNITTEHNRMVSDMYSMAVDAFVPELFDALAAAVTLGKDGVICPRGDKNFAMWAILPYVIAMGKMPPQSVSFEEAATVRPDGGENICQCVVKNADAEPMQYSQSLSIMGGPCWNGNDKLTLWLMDTVWGGARVAPYFSDALTFDLSSLITFYDGMVLEDDDVPRMAERGYITREVERVTPSDGIVKAESNGSGYNAAAIFNPDISKDSYGIFKDTLEIVWLDKHANERLFGIANSIREKHHAALEKIKTIYTPKTPAHMKKAREYVNQHMFYSDGMFIIFALNRLLESGKLQLPTEAQRKSLCAVMVSR